MSDPYMGEIKMFGFDFAPRGYAFCRGQTLLKDQHEQLFDLLGHKFGGVGDLYRLPDMQGRIPIGEGNGYTVGDADGAPSVLLWEENLPRHRHGIRATAKEADEISATDHFLAKMGSAAFNSPDATALLSLNVNTVSFSGDVDGEHDNMQPYLAISFCIAIDGASPPKP